MQRQAILFGIVAVLWTINAIVHPTTFNLILAAIWWALAAFSEIAQRRTAHRDGKPVH